MAQEHTIAKDLLTRLPVAAIILQILTPRGEDPMPGSQLTQAIAARTEKAPFSAMYALKNYSPPLVSDIIDDKGRPQDRFIATPLGLKVGGVLLKLLDEDSAPVRAPSPTAEPDEPAPKRRGRPAGSKTKTKRVPKAKPTADQEG